MQAQEHSQKTASGTTAGDTSALRQFARYVSLSILGTLGVSCYILADTFFVAQGLGTNGLAALNIALPAYNFIFGAGMMLGMGGSTKFSISKSARGRTGPEAIFTGTVFLALLLGLCFAVIGLTCARPLAVFLGADTETLGMTTTYLHYLLLFAPAFLLNDVLLFFVRNDNGPQLAAVAQLAGNFANIVLDYILIFPLKMGILGAVLATCVSPMLGILILALHLRRPGCGLHFARAPLRWPLMRQIFALGMPSLITQVTSGIAILFFNLLTLHLSGNVGVAAYSVVANIGIVISALYSGLAEGIQPLVSTAYGAGDTQRIRLYRRYALTAVLLSSALLYLAIFCLASPITALFNKAQDPRMTALAVPGLRIYFSAVALVGLNTLRIMLFTAMEQPRPAQLLSLLRGFVLLLPLAFVLARLRGMTGVWLSYPCTEGIVALLGVLLYRRYGKESK